MTLVNSVDLAKFRQQRPGITVVNFPALESSINQQSHSQKRGQHLGCRADGNFCSAQWSAVTVFFHN